jgi:hypothetical protein
VFLRRFPTLATLVDGLKLKMKTLAPVHLRKLLRLAEAYGQDAFLAAAARAQAFRRFDALAVARILQRAQPEPPDEPPSPLGGNGAVVLGEVDPGSLDVTALYEIVPARVQATPTTSLLTVRLRYKLPDGGSSCARTFPLVESGTAFESASEDFRFTAAVASLGLVLLKSRYRGSSTLDSALAIAQRSRSWDPAGYRAQFVDLIRAARSTRLRPRLIREHRVTPMPADSAARRRAGSRRGRNDPRAAGLATLALAGGVALLWLSASGSVRNVSARPIRTVPRVPGGCGAGRDGRAAAR